MTDDGVSAVPDPSIFRAYDIRGIAGENLGADVVRRIGGAFAARCLEEGVDHAVIGGDGRASTPALAEALAAGLARGGVRVTDIGCVPTPVLYFATDHLATHTGIMITGSHNPPEYNGLKMMIAGTTLAGDAIDVLRRYVEAGRGMESGRGDGEVARFAGSMVDIYQDAVLANVLPDGAVLGRTLKVVVDSGNGVGGLVAPALLRRMGCEVISLFEEVDSAFPNHHPDPADPNNLEDLQNAVRSEGADLGIAFDGDADRLGVITETGAIVWPDRYLMHFAEDIAPEHPGKTIIFDVKCGRHLANVIRRAGGEPLMWKTGHSHIKAKLRETGAVLAGEFSGHICFADRWLGFDDALYAGARLVESLARRDEGADACFARYPATVSTPEIKLETTEEDKAAIIEQLKGRADFGGTVNDLDGVRVDFDDGWGLARPSNTSPVITLRFEADNAEALERIRGIFARELAAIDPSLVF